MSENGFYKKYPWAKEIEQRGNITSEEKRMIDETRELYEKHPFYPEPKPIDVLNLIMRRRFAEDIINGKKKLEFRIASQHYWDRLMSKETAKYLDRYKDDKFLWEVGGNIMRPVDMIHFHDYNNSWWLDVEVLDGFTFSPDKDGVEMLHKEFDCHEFDEQQRELEMLKTRFSNYPLYFVFEIGNVLGRSNI